MYSRHNPAPCFLKERVELTAGYEGQATFFLTLETPDDLRFTSGDCAVIFPENAPQRVKKIIDLMQWDPTTPVTMKAGTFSVEVALTCYIDFSKVTTRFAHLLSTTLKKEVVHADLKKEHLDDVLAKWNPPLDPQQFVEYCQPLLPRYYSIASAPRPGGLDLLIAHVSDGVRHGACSHFLCYGAQKTTPLRLFIMPGHLRCPSAATPLIMIGPGTGIAPFRAFIQERTAQHALAHTWLFFGEKTEKYGFFFRPMLEDAVTQGMHLSTAFSRDQPEKIYVQHRLQQHASKVWAWLQEGAHIYVCGDAKKMAKDVQRQLERIVAEHGGMSQEEAAAYLRALRQSRRYCLDVY